jgi:DNA polymerase-1
VNKLVSIDYSQIEMRLAAHISQDVNMLHAFEHDKDIHTFTAALAYEIPESQVDKKSQRDPLKRVGFGVLYGISSKGLKEQFDSEGIVHAGTNDLWSEQECQELIDKWYGVFPMIRAMQGMYVRQAKDTGMVRDIFGRIRRIPGIYSSLHYVYGEACRWAMNAPIQSSAAGIIKIAMDKVRPVCSNLNAVHTCRPLIQIHDELLFEIDTTYLPAVALMLRREMENVITLSVPIKCDIEIGDNWADMKPYKEN